MVRSGACGSGRDICKFHVRDEPPAPVSMQRPRGSGIPGSERAPGCQDLPGHSNASPAMIPSLKNSSYAGASRALFSKNGLT